MTSPEPTDVTAPPSLPEPGELADELESPQDEAGMAAQQDSEPGTEEQR